MAVDKGTCIITVQWDDEVGGSVLVCSKCNGKSKSSGRTIARCPKCGAKITEFTIGKRDLNAHAPPEVNAKCQ